MSLEIKVTSGDISMSIAVNKSLVSLCHFKDNERLADG